MQVPESLYPLLAQNEGTTLTDRLRQQGREFVAEEPGGKQFSPFAEKLLALLTISTKFRMPYKRFEKLAMILDLPISEVGLLFAHAQEHAFIDEQGRLTEAGRFELSRLRERNRSESHVARPKVVIDYYPKSIKHQA
jgi:hypothetical protein